MASIWDSVQNNILAAFALTINTDEDQDNFVQCGVSYGSVDIDIVSDVLTPTRRHHSIKTEGGAATDDVNSISVDNLSDGAEIILRLDTTGQTVTFKHAQGGSGEIYMPDGQDLVLDDMAQSVQFQRRGTAWYQIAYTAQAGPFTEYGESDPQTWAINSAGNVDVSQFTPPLSGAPSEWGLYILCEGAQYNYQVGDKIRAMDTSTPSQDGITCFVRGTAVHWAIGNSLNIIDANGSIVSALNSTNFKIVLTAKR